jgi:hypothetical protein
VQEGIVQLWMWIIHNEHLQPHLPFDESFEKKKQIIIKEERC